MYVLLFNILSYLVTYFMIKSLMVVANLLMHIYLTYFSSFEYVRVISRSESEKALIKCVTESKVNGCVCTEQASPAPLEKQPPFWLI